MGDKKNYFITTPIYYVNDSPHIGHAYTTLACDVLARFQRLDGLNVKFLTGTDEHGQKVEKAANNEGITPKKFVDKMSKNFSELTKSLNTSNDIFIRTTDKMHIKSVQSLWERLESNKQIYLDKYAGWYSVTDEAYYSQDEVTKINNENIAPTGAKVEWVEEPSYFFKLSEWQDPLLEFYQKNSDFIAPESRKNEVISFVKEGLRDLSISRTSFKWGVPVPKNSDHVVYVWLDALANYISALGFPNTKDQNFADFWPADLHMVGKDILRFHAVYWPAFLMAANLPIPKRIFAHGWWTNEGKKISKSLNNIIDPLELLQSYGLDRIRYFLLREVPFGSDGNFSREAIFRRSNNELSNDLGNLMQRVFSLIFNNFEGMIPESGSWTSEDKKIIKQSNHLIEGVRQEISKQCFHKALDKIWFVIMSANKYIDQQAPWNLKDKDINRMKTILYVLTESIRHISIVMQPFIPNAMQKVLDYLSIPKEMRDFSKLNDKFQITAGTKIIKPKAIFPRLDEAKENHAPV